MTTQYTTDPRTFTEQQENTVPDPFGEYKPLDKEMPAVASKLLGYDIETINTVRDDVGEEPDAQIRSVIRNILGLDPDTVLIPPLLHQSLDDVASGRTVFAGDVDELFELLEQDRPSATE